jgi:predicted transcriptional regulator
MSIKPEHMDNIAARHKNHEYRRYLLPPSVRHIWFYTSAPFSAIHYVACISNGKVPGQVPEDGGIGNEDFNAGKKLSKYGYEIQELWKLEQPISLQQAKLRGYLKGPPQKYCYVPQVLLESCPLEKQNNVFRIEVQPQAKRTKISQFFTKTASGG